MSDSLTVAIVHEVFPGEPAAEALTEHLTRARAGGASLALLPELPLDHWAPALPDPVDGDAEVEEGPRHRRLAAAAKSAGIAVLGGAIVIDEASGERRNRALLLDASGRCLLQYDKLHLPQEEGFWEASHYRPGVRPTPPTDALGLPVAVQICSDLFRPQGSHLLGALGAELIAAPRATEGAGYERWKTMIRSNAMSSCAFVIAINRPRPEGAAAIGGPSIAVAPDGRVLLETTDPVSIVTLDREEIRRARKAYPGYLDVRAGLYADAWRAIAEKRGQ